MDKNKKAIIGTIFAITSILAGLSIYVSWELRRDLAPEDTSADIGTPVPSSILEPTKNVDKKKEPSKVPPTKVPPTKVVVTSGPTVTRPAGGGVVATPIPSGPLPSTALVNDRVDALLIGSFMMLTGIILYKKYLSFGNKRSVQ